MMKINIPLPLKFVRAVSQFILFVLFFCLASCSDPWEINNPYGQVDWEKHLPYKANLHTHTSRSDGSMAPQQVVDQYYQLGYRILALTDHNEVTYPWTGFELLEPSVRSKERVAEGILEPEVIEYRNRDPKSLEMIAIQGNEVSSPHHMGSYFNDYNRPTKLEDSTMYATAAKNGLAILNHPGRYDYPAEWYVDHYRRYKHLVGLEIYNQGDRYPGDRQLWDSILVRLAPERMVWAFSNDDMHRQETLGRNWNIFVLPGLTEEWVRKGMEEGRSFYVYAPDGHAGTMPPAIASVQINKRKGIIAIAVSGQDSVRWISGGNVVHRGTWIDLGECPDASVYVRAEIFGPGGTIVGTQPFGFKKP
ncbi:PHP domain-containing protein [Gaoshiqia sp. Z1-71]|uniref:PHP domain-containing protein n=1 Tax=Gaoshiqia hydrogeniformans TaxID=3290090 RepID=UPI003BF7FBF0